MTVLYEIPSDGKRQVRVCKPVVHDLPPPAAALWHVERGVPVFPVHWDKHPLTRHGYLDASRDAELVARWWERWPMALIACPTGAQSGLLAIDIDMKPGGPDGERQWNKLLVRFGVGEPVTQMTLTPSGGRHLLFRYPAAGEEIRNSAGRLAPGLDVRGQGGSIILPGSRNALGVYELLHEDIEPQALPEWLATCLRLLKDILPRKTPQGPAQANGNAGRAWALAALDNECRVVAGAAKGCRNDQLNRSCFAIGQIVGAGLLAESEANEHLWHAAMACGLPNFEASGTIRSGMKSGMANPRYPAEASDA
ncbi:bifunctional DNA primase/polymerase [Rhizobium mayense]|uniref:Bifunctional DNA primase/polymerase n=1 Tax=Rhizobium mayense TaxID=1312184 RepID=A0ABT7JQ99_9HYPH|nr:bifunctional DNA primase/polymerase [Rhizobium mayense]MDL2398426.1 bifunctional DNA primase/polymerase [Rhizobium mayense]